MRKTICLAMLIAFLIPSVAHAGAVTPTSTFSAQGIFKILHFAHVDDGDTWTAPSAAVKEFWIQPVATTTAVYGHATKSSTTWTFELSASVTELWLFIVE